MWVIFIIIHFHNGFEFCSDCYPLFRTHESNIRQPSSLFAHQNMLLFKKKRKTLITDSMYTVFFYRGFCLCFFFGLDYLGLVFFYNSAKKSIGYLPLYFFTYLTVVTVVFNAKNCICARNLAKCTFFNIFMLVKPCQRWTKKKTSRKDSNNGVVN